MAAGGTTPVRGTLVHRALRAEPGEGRGVALSGAFFFCVLFGYFLLRPVREAMGVQRGMSDLWWLFGITCVVSLVATLAFGGVVSRLDRRRFIAVAFRVVIACLGVFIALRASLGEHEAVWAGYAFYVWLSVMNLFVVSVFWAFMADVWALGQGKRLFPVIGVGGTLGAIAGSGAAWLQGSGWLGPAAQAWGWAGLMALSAVAFEGGVRVMRAIDRRPRPAAGGAEPGRGTPRPRGPVGGPWWEGATTVARSPYLLGVGLYLMLMAVSNTLLYFTQANLVSNAEEELHARIGLFAQLDFWTQVATLLVQLFITGRLMRSLGVGVTLGVLPAVTALGFGALAWVSGIEGVAAWQVFAVFAAFNALHRATRYAIARPARETLFAVVPEAQKYKAKPIVDVFLYRGGDVLGVGVERGLALAGLAIGGVAMAVAPAAAVWILLSLWLAREQSRRARSGEAETGQAEPQDGPGVAPEQGAVA